MYLGIDIGTGSIKAVLTKGNDLINHVAGYPPGSGVQYEEDPADLEDTLIRLVIEMIQNNRISRGDIKGISICGHGPSILFVDSSGRHLTNIVTWQDRRAEEEARFLRKTLKNFAKDGSSYEAKILWFYNSNPKLFESGNTAFYPKDYILFRLCGSRIIDSSTASTIRFFDPENGAWKLPDTNIPDGIFPEIKDPWEQVGLTGTDFSRKCGLPDGIPLYGGGIDAYGEALGAGAIDPGQLVDGTGTSTCVSLCCGSREGKDLHVIPDRSLNIEMMSFTGGSIAWGLDLFSESTAFLRNVDPRRPPDILFLPYLLGERSPVWDENARGVFVGLRADTGREQLLQAILQGVGFGVRQCLELLSRGTDYKGTVVRAVGGGANNRQWLKIKANITGKAYEKMKTSDSTALGAAILAAYAGGYGELSALVRNWALIEETIPPDRDAAGVYDELFQIYSHLYKDLKESFVQLSSLHYPQYKKGDLDNAAV